MSENGFAWAYKNHWVDVFLTSFGGLNFFHSLLLLQAARQGLTEAQQQLGSAKDEVAKAEAAIGVEVYDALVMAAES